MDSRTRDVVSEISSSGLKLLELINDILEITQMDAGETRANDLVFVADIVDSAIAGMRPVAEKGGVALRGEVAEMLPPLRGDGETVAEGLAQSALERREIHGKGRLGASFGGCDRGRSGHRSAR